MFITLSRKEISLAKFRNKIQVCSYQTSSQVLGFLISTAIFSNGMYFITIYYILKSVRVLELLYLTIKIILHYLLFVCTDFEFNIISFMERLQIVRGKLKTKRWYDTRGRETANTNEIETFSRERDAIACCLKVKALRDNNCNHILKLCNLLS